jgi:DNA polymerase-3 subunit alpha
MVDFVHIHSHSSFSKFDGFSKIDDTLDKDDNIVMPGIVGTAKRMGMPAVALTDHGTVAGAITFLKACRKGDVGIKPILGMEAYQSRDHACHSTEGQPDKRRGNRHVIILAKNSQGYANLCTLSQIASLEGYHYDPRIDIDLLDKYKEGLIVSTACLSNVVNWNLSIDRYEKAKAAAAIYKDIFGDDFYLEMMYHGLDLEAKVLPGIQKISKELNVKSIVTNDCHYVEKSHAKYHETLMCMSSGRSIKDPKHIKFPYDEFYFKSGDEMAEVFGHLPRSMANTLEIAEKCDYSDMNLGQRMLLPKFDLPEGYALSFDYLKDMAWKGLQSKGLNDSVPHRERLQRELDDVKLIWDTQKFGFDTYFLIVRDIIEFTRRKKIPGGIRGSGYGSLLLYCLGISEGVDPVRYNLLWERFLGFEWAYKLFRSDFGIKD